MPLKPVLFIQLLAMVVGATAVNGTNTGQSDAPTVMDGVYSSSQAMRGAETYAVYCRQCHSADLSGGSDDTDPAPALRTVDFALQRRDLGNLFAYIRRTMPRDGPGTVRPAAIADVIAFLLRENGFPAGPSDLSPDPEALSRITIVRRP